MQAARSAKEVATKLAEQARQEKLKELDPKTLHVAAGVVGQVGFQHFHMSQDTRLTVEARKAHRFVAINCEEISKQVLRLTGANEEGIQAMLHELSKQIKSHWDANKKPA